MIHVLGALIFWLCIVCETWLILIEELDVEFTNEV